MSAVETDSDANEHAADDAVTSVDVKDEKPQAANAACDRRRVCHKGKTAVSKDNRVQKTRTENTSVAQDIQENVSIVGEASTRKRYICDKCETVFSYPSRFLSHYRRSHLKEFQRKICPYCPRAFTLSTSGNYLLRLTMYIFDWHSHCSYFSGTSNIGRHIRTAHQGQIAATTTKYPSIKCTDCDSVFCGPLEYYEHSKVHDQHVVERTDGYNLNCDTCQIDLVSFDNFHQHMHDQHGIVNRRDVKPVKCRWCGERCRNLLGLCTHIRIVHKLDGRVGDTVPSDMLNMAARDKATTYLCMVCGKILRSQSSYNHHMAIHVGVKQFVCDICQAKFMSSASLVTHKLVHSQERKQQCKECGKTFKQLGHLKTHLKSHGIGVKEKFSCNICHKEFIFRGVLKEHMWVHKKDEAKPHICSDCGRGFVRRHKLNEHINKEHGDVKKSGDWYCLLQINPIFIQKFFGIFISVECASWRPVDHQTTD